MKRYRAVLCVATLTHMGRRSRKEPKYLLKSESPRERAPIDHSAIIDGHGRLAKETHYEDRVVSCGDCGKSTLFSAAAQKLVFERHGIPVKMLHAPACVPCRKKRAARRRKRQAIAAAKNRLNSAMELLLEHSEDPIALLEAVEARLAVQHAGAHVAQDKTMQLLNRARRLGADEERFDALRDKVKQTHLVDAPDLVDASD